MTREIRYVVMKLKDIDKYLTTEEKDTLARIGEKIAVGRRNDGKGIFGCVVVEHQWPEYEPTWALIAARVDREPDANHCIS